MIIKIIARIYAAWVHSLEHKIGYHLKFTHIPDAWINSLMIFDMTKAWAKHGIKATGVNYFTVGSLVNGVSSRFIRGEKQYQSWLGAYLVKFEENRNFTLQDHFNLAVADQLNWLNGFGDKHPFIQMPAENVGKAQTFNIGPYQGKLYEFLGGPSHSDVGPNNGHCYNRFEMSVMAEVMNLLNSALRLKGKNFVPTDTATNYETVTLTGYAGIITLEQNTHVVLYGNSAIIKNPNGTKTSYAEFLKDEIVAAFKSIEIEKIN